MNLSQSIAIGLLILSASSRCSDGDQLLSFEEFPPQQTGYGAALTNGYGGLYWSGLYVLLPPSGSPERLGVVSGNNIAANINTSVEISQAFPFSVKSVWATSTNNAPVTIYAGAKRDGTNLGDFNARVDGGG